MAFRNFGALDGKAVERAAADARRIVLVRPTEDPAQVFALSLDALDETTEVHILSRTELLEAKRLFGGEDLGIGLFTSHAHVPETAPVVLFEEMDRALAAGLPHVRSRIMDPLEAETHERRVERIFDTADPEVKLVISRRVIDDADAEPHYVSKGALDRAHARYGDAMRLSDLEMSGSRPAIVGMEGRSHLRSEFTWFDVDGDERADGMEGPS